MAELFLSEGVQVVVFDAYGTLFDMASPIQKHLGVLADKAAELSKLWRAKQLEYSWSQKPCGRPRPFLASVPRCVGLCIRSLENK